MSLGFVGTSRGSPVEILGQADQALLYATNMVANRCASTMTLVATGELANQSGNDDVELFWPSGGCRRPERQRSGSRAMPRLCNTTARPTAAIAASRCLALPQTG